MGLDFYVGPELEYFYFKSATEPEVIDEGGYFDVLPADLGNDLRKQTMRTLDRLGIPMEASHHEVAPSQHEIDPHYDEALVMADRVMICRLIVKEVAAHNGVHATFMPKPLHGENGSGMHVHQSLFRGDTNAFFSADDADHLSDDRQGFIAGQLSHMREICSLLNQYVNSFKRLVPGFEAPVHISWAHRNRTALIRVPLYIQGKESTMRAELRNPDPAANPYLAFAVMLAAGLDGIEKGTELPPSVEPNIYKMSSEEREAIGLSSLPNNLYEADPGDAEERARARDARRARLRPLHHQQAQRVVRVPRAGLSLGGRQVPGHRLAGRDRPTAHVPPAHGPPPRGSPPGRPARSAGDTARAVRKVRPRPLVKTMTMTETHPVRPVAARVAAPLVSLLLALALVFVLAAAPPAFAESDATVWVVPGTAKVFPDTTPGVSHAVALSAAGNEYEAAQIAVSLPAAGPVSRRLDRRQRPAADGCR